MKPFEIKSAESFTVRRESLRLSVTQAVWKKCLVSPAELGSSLSTLWESIHVLCHTIQSLGIQKPTIISHNSHIVTFTCSWPCANQCGENRHMFSCIWRWQYRNPEEIIVRFCTLLPEFVYKLSNRWKNFRAQVRKANIHPNADEYIRNIMFLHCP